MKASRGDEAGAEDEVCVDAPSKPETPLPDCEKDEADKRRRLLNEAVVDDPDEAWHAQVPSRLPSDQWDRSLFSAGPSLTRVRSRLERRQPPRLAD